MPIEGCRWPSRVSHDASARRLVRAAAKMASPTSRTRSVRARLSQMQANSFSHQITRMSTVETPEHIQLLFKRRQVFWHTYSRKFLRFLIQLGAHQEPLLRGL